MNMNGKCEINMCLNPNDENGKYSMQISNCLFITNTKCDECQSGYLLTNNSCVKSEEEHCEQQNAFGCTRCEDSYYFNMATKRCEKCDENCMTCFETSTQCLSCYYSSYLTNYKCISNDNLKEKCSQFASKSSGCVVCKNSYYRVGLDCLKCNEKCLTCNNNEQCLTCNSTNFKTINNDCLPQSGINGCKDKVTQIGCLNCQDGYFTVNSNACEKCDENCETCLLTNKKCTSCNSTHVLLSNNKCVNITQILKCTEITNSKCTKCSFWNSPNKDGTLCNTQVVWWVILIIVIIILIIIVTIFIIIAIIIKQLLSKIHKKELAKTTTVFEMNKSNVHFISFQGGICVSSEQIDFNSEEETIQGNVEHREVFCVGNATKNILKIQFTVSSQIDKYKIRMEPQIVTLKKQFACEFSIYLTPLCTCKIDNSIQIVSNNMKTNEVIFNQIQLKGVTNQSTRIATTS
ncbi:hypothetical protein EIN_480170 [Entamoeba invadens IP1]|uniref:Cysteine surface protein n=1 Tax=Entamoeba invadens IP1 TaxID=370355 RepID=L7FN57_ENTIV|nr:hypothetical protein EIN_480170 [Entamoeba invadens IP1]ELP91148.1 hypothetical protein EIN_480170 [Entamoeba invadens IP1]|eukprot:XP_004257919.1 hypothetical protein EIN_480170 [Entamoeba invadens IP1]